MPQRSTEFQRLIALISCQVAPRGAIVTESKMLRCQLTGEELEADVVIEHSVGPHPVTIVLECREQKRPASKEWVREVQGKYRDVECSKIVMVSKSGFYLTAEHLARKLGIQPLTLREATQDDWSSILDGVTQVEAYDCNLSFSHAALIMMQGPIGPDVPLDQYPIRNETAVIARSFSDFMDRLLEHEPFLHLVSDTAKTTGRTELPIQLNFSVPTFIDIDGVQRVGLKGIQLTAVMEQNLASVPLQVKQYVDKRVAVGRGIAFGATIDVALVQSPNEPGSAAIQIGEVRFEGRLLTRDEL